MQKVYAMLYAGGTPLRMVILSLENVSDTPHRILVALLRLLMEKLMLCAIRQRGLTKVSKGADSIYIMFKGVLAIIESARFLHT